MLGPKNYHKGLPLTIFFGFLKKGQVPETVYFFENSGETLVLKLQGEARKVEDRWSSWQAVELEVLGEHRSS